MVLFLLSLISLTVFLFPHFIFVVVKLLSWMFNFHVAYRPFLATSIVLTLVWLLLFCWGHWFGRFFHETKEVEIECKGLPNAFIGYKIVHVSDLHLDGWQENNDKLLTIVNEINAQKPDLIVFTGDIVSLSQNELMPLLPVLKQLKAKDGVVSVMGNHDYMPYDRKSSEKERAANVAELQRMEREDLGWTLLLNENIVLRRGGDSIAVVGCENQSMGVHSVVQRGDLAKALDGTRNMFHIIQTHDPTHWRGEIVKNKEMVGEGALTLSGHTHSGQFRVMGFSVAKFIYDEYDGLYTEGDMHLYVNIGLGGTMPMRVGATPEITVMKLK